MMERFSKLITLLICTALSTFPLVSTGAVEFTADPQEYTAVYKVLRKNKNIGEVTVRLSQSDGIWTLHGFTHDMRGLADVLNVKGSQMVTGKWQDDRFLPENFDYSFSLIGYKTSWHAKFDWPSGIVTTRSRSGKTRLPLDSGALDPFSLFLNTRSYLAKNQSTMTVDVIDEDEIENHLYRAELQESVQTGLGCLKTTQVKRIRRNSKRTSLVWYANEYDFIPVQMLHFKKKDKSLRLQIISLKVAGQPVHPVGSCDNNDNEFNLTKLG